MGTTDEPPPDWGESHSLERLGEGRIIAALSEVLDDNERSPSRW